MKPPYLVLIGLTLPGILSAPARAQDSQAAQPSTQSTPDDETYSLRYRFRPGETVRWAGTMVIDAPVDTSIELAVGTEMPGTCQVAV